MGENRRLCQVARFRSAGDRVTCKNRKILDFSNLFFDFSQLPV